MNQEKIGRFICKLRKEKGMTQQDLANRLGVTDKAISKWENGRSMMDISLLKPLSECLGVSIVEIINGERMDDKDKILKSDDVVLKTVDYADSKIKRIIFSVGRIVGVVFICLVVLFLGIIYKIYCAYELFYIDMDDYFIDGESYDKVVNIDSFYIDNKVLNEDEYLNLDGLKIRNDFLGYERVLSDSDDIEIDGYIYRDSYYDYDKKEGVIYQINDSYIDVFKNYSYDRDRGDTVSRREKFLLDNNIDNDMDLFNYVRDNYNIRNEWYYSINKMRNNYMMMEFGHDYVFRDVDDTKKISGKFEGYMYSYSYKNWDTCDKSYTRVLEIFDNGKVYSITFIGDKYMDNDYMIDLISTIEISY